MAAPRQRSLVVLSLSCILVTLVGFRLYRLTQPTPLPPPATPVTLAAADTTAAGADVDPNRIRIIAQLSPQTANSVAANPNVVTATPAYARCGPQPAASPTVPEFSCDQPSVQIAEYVTPTCGGEGSSCGVVNSSSITLTDSYIGNVSNEVINLGNGFIKQRSNDIHFIYRNNGGFISLMQDTIWGGGPANGFFVCDGTNQEAFYRVYDQNGNWGNRQYPATMSCGVPHTNQGQLRSFKKISDSGFNINAPGADPLVPESQLTECNVTGQSRIVTSNTGRLIFQGQAKCNGVDFDMIALQNVSGAGAGEVNMYCKGKGLCAFYQNLDITQPGNRPSEWKGKDLCNLKAGGSRGSLPTYFEYNLQRQCGDTSRLVLNNLVDEYSVSCVPKAEYVLSLVDRENCWRTPKGCANWNTTGDLRITAGGTIFGLFRSESAVSARYNTMNGLRDKNRQESLEAYLTAKSDRIPLSAQAAGARFNDLNRPSVDNLLSFQSPLYKLSTLDQQCELVFDKLVAVKELCDPFNRIEGEAGKECAINQFLPNTSLRYTDMLRVMTAPDGRSSRCGQLMYPGPNDTNGQKIRDQILSIDPAMEVAYRPAFILLATLVGDPQQRNPQFRSQGNDKGYFYQVDYLEIKVPTFGSDFMDRKSLPTASNPSRPGSSYRDPLRFLGDVLLTPDMQEQYRQEEENDRQAIRQRAAQFDPDNLRPGEVIGAGELPIKCRNSKGTYTTADCDNIARALITFVNSSTVVPVTPGEANDGSSLHRQYSPPRNWLPSSKCVVEEKELYGNALLTDNPVEEKYRVAQQAQQIGTRLEAQDVGLYRKKKEGFAEVEANVTDMLNNPKSGDFGRTQIFYISPHNYTLLYAQNAMMTLLTKEQQETLLRNETFNSVLKTTGLDSFSSSKAVSYYPDPASGGAPSGSTPPAAGAPPSGNQAGTPPTGNAPAASQVPRNMKEVSAELQRAQENGKTLDSPLMWQVAGNVASFPTRLFTLLTTNVDNTVRQFTLGCGRTADGKPNPFATENWLLKRCKPTTDELAQRDNIPPSDTASGQCIQPFVDQATAQSYASQLRATLPGQQARSSSFAGWAAYYSVADEPQIQHLFNRSCEGGQLCYDYILNRLLSTPVNGQYLNPYLVIAISLNETGGLISRAPGFVGPHFGCGIGGSGEGGQIISDNTIERKLGCVLGFFTDNATLPAPDLLTKYGYRNGNRNANLSKIMGILSNGQVPTQCGNTPIPPTN